MKLSRRDALICLLLALITLAVYWQLCSADFILYDDANYVTDNPHVQHGVNWTEVQWAFTTGHAGNWHPLTWISHMLDCQWFGLNPGRHHLTNILLHAANACLLFILFRAMTGAFWRSAIIAALFAWHPVHVESVAWVAERKDVLSTFFELLCLFAYVCYAQTAEAATLKRKIWYVFSLLCFALGLMSKPMIVTLPCLMLLLDYWPLRRFAQPPQRAAPKSQPIPAQKMVFEKIPFFFLSGASCFVTYLVQSGHGATDRFSNIPPGVHLANILIAYVRYLGKIFWPTHLAIFYPYDLTPPIWQVAGAITLILIVIVAAVLARRKRPFCFVGWFWFMGMLVPAVGVIQVGLQSIADRYLYMPAVGIFLIATWTLAEISIKPAAKLCSSVLASAALIGCLAMTWIQTGCWHDPERLFRHSLDITGSNPMIEYNLGYALMQKGKLAEAVSHFEASESDNPNQFFAEHNLGVCLANLGKFSDAANHYAHALKLSGTNWLTHFDYGVALEALGHNNDALSQYSEAVELAQNESQPHFALSALLLKEKRPEEAKSQVMRLLALNPSYVPAHILDASILSSLGDVSAAINEYRAALQLDPNAINALNNLAWILATDKNDALRNGNEAVRLAEKACELTHRQEPVLIGTLAAAYAEAGRFDDAVQAGEQASRLAAAGGEKNLEQRNKELVELYRAKKAFHE